MTHLPARKHRWDHDNIAVTLAHESPTGCELHERTCVLCGMVKITNIPPRGFPWHTWRSRDGGEWHGEATPPCLERVAA